MANACEAIIGNPRMLLIVAALVGVFYDRNRELLQDAGYDPEDLEQELMLELCEEDDPQTENRAQRNCTDRLKNIIRDLRQANRPICNY